MVGPADFCPPHPRRVYLETFGCQMNELDSELVRGHLGALGYAFTKSLGDADVVLYNTCSVRQQAENKVLSRLGRMAIAKRDGHQVVVGVIGCMAEREGRTLMRRYPQVDLMCGPGELDKLPMLIDNCLRAQSASVAERVALQGATSRRSTTLSAAGDNLEMLDLARAFDPDPGAVGGGRSAYVRITRGCNKFCSYCVVPRTRGAEVHRPPDAIVDECRRLADAGVVEVTLLGQTVNHYVYTHGVAISVGGRETAQVGPGASAFRREGRGDRGGRERRETTFADLLARIHDEVPGICRLRFVTSYPRDFGDDILQVMAASPRICRYLHVPAQSGSNRVLGRMNRGYTREEYLEFVDRARAFLPDVCIAGDFIVGFCGETDEDYEQSRTLLERVRFKNSFIFKYSPRPGTVADDRMADDVPEGVKRWRNNDLLALQARISAEVHAEQEGRTVDVFVERVSERSQAAPAAPRVRLGWEGPAEPQQTIQMSGRTGGDLITVFDLPAGVLPERLMGRILPVEIVGSGALILRGRPVESTVAGAVSGDARDSLSTI